MRYRAWISAGVLLAMGCATGRPLDTVPSVDLTRYGGKWYEVARLPNVFQRRCSGDVTAEYAVKKDGTIQVVNRCAAGQGDPMSAEGAARVASPSGPNSRLAVSFLPEGLRWIPFTRGDYWILELGPEYEYSVVGTPDRKYFWILSRTPRLEETVIEGILERAAKRGFDTAAVTRTQQSAD